jgi:hypothetical protein
MGAETYDVDFGHGARKIARKRGESKGGVADYSKRVYKTNDGGKPTL